MAYEYFRHRFIIRFNICGFSSILFCRAWRCIGLLSSHGSIWSVSTYNETRGTCAEYSISSITSVRFYRAGCLSWSVFLPIALPAVPFAYLGGSITVSTQAYKIIAGLVLLYSAYRLFFFNTKQVKTKPLNIPLAIVCGIAIGFLSGIIGVGGGIFLSPLLLFLNWSLPREASGVAAVFILVNSISGLMGHISSVHMLPNFLPYLAVAAISGGLIGSKYGASKFNRTLIVRILSIVLVTAGVKLILV
jgi:uncharacterized membrane protein YfcA